MDKKYSICIPTYNRAKYLKDAVQSAVNQSFEKYEVIIVDDGSTDNTEELINSFNSPRIKFFKKDHQGAPFARNFCVRAAEGDYILWLDSDDILDENILKIYDNKVKEYPDTDILYCNLQLIDEYHDPKNVYTYHDWYNDPEGMVAFLYTGSPIPNPGVLISKKVFSEIGPYNEEFPRAHDFEFWARVALSKKFKAKHINQILCNYRIHNNNLTGELSENTNYHCEIKIFSRLFEELNLKEIFPNLDWIHKPKEALFESYYKAAQKFSHLKGYKEAIAYLEKCLNINPDPEIFNQQAILYFNSGNIEKSHELYSDLIKKYPENRVVQKNADTVRNIFYKNNFNPKNNKSFPKTKLNQRSFGSKNRQYLTGRSPGFSFCVISAGKRLEKLSLLIKSIHDQKIPVYEIIVTGIAESREDILYVPMPEAAQSGKIANLRNAAAEKSHYNHLVFVDDDIVFFQGWYTRLEPYAEKYDLISTKILNLDGTRFWDWSTIGGPRGHVMLDYDEFDEHIYLTGGLLITTAKVWETIRWDDQRGINEFEDVDFSKRAKETGFKFYCCKDSVAVHNDPKYTQVGRRVYVRKDGGIRTWLCNELNLLSPEELLERAAKNLKEGLIAEAADCVRYCLWVDPNNDVVKNAWQSFVKQIDFPTDDDGRWQPYPILDMNSIIDDPSDTPSVYQTSAFLTNQINNASRESGIVIRNIPDSPLPINSTPAIIWHAPIFDPSGYADEARNFILQLQKQNIQPVVREIGRRSDMFRDGLDEKSRTRLDKAIAQETPEDFISIIQFPAYAFERILQARYHIGRTTFETDGLPVDWVQKCNLMDEIWVPSKFNMQTFKAAGVTSKLFKIPEGVDAERFRPGLDALKITGAKGVVFLSIFEWIYRKGWDVLLKSWAKAFGPDDDVSLVLRTYPMNATDSNEAKQKIEGRINQFLKTELKISRQEVAPIIILTDQLYEQDMPCLYAAADAYVLPSRGEGWGRTQMEAMACGLPVLSTRWSGNLEFMNDHNSFLIDINGLTLIDERTEIPFYRGQKWAEPSVEHLSALMHKVVENPTAVRRIGRRARLDIERYWGWERIAAIAAKRLRAINTEIEHHSVTTCGSNAAHTVMWEGSQFVNHSLALVNRELCIELAKRKDIELSLIPYEPDEFGVGEDSARFGLIEERLRKPLSGAVDFHVRHQWPPNFTPPPEGHWIIIQPWEFGALPKDWVEPMETLADELWVPSNHVRDVYINSGITPDKVFVVPNGVNYDQFHPQTPKLKLATTKRFKFLFVGGTIMRKGIDILLDAFTTAFSNKDDVCLVIKDMGGESFYRGQNASQMIEDIKKNPASPEILYLTGTLRHEEIAGLYTACDCLVHPYRGEGFGLPVAEAMACGLPVIVTKGGACDDFCSEQNAYLIDSTVRSIHLKNHVLSAPGWLLEPNKLQLMEMLRFVYEQPKEAEEKGTVAARQIRQEVDWKMSTDQIMARLKALKSKPVRRFANSADSQAVQAMTSPQEIYQSIQQSMKNKSPEEVINELEMLAESFPQFALAHNDLGVLHYQVGNKEKAHQFYEKAVELDPENMVFQKNLADLLFVELGRIEETLKIYVNILALNPHDVETLLITGHICVALNKFDDARDFYLRVLELEPGNEDAGNNLQELDKHQLRNDLLPPESANAFSALTDKFESDDFNSDRSAAGQQTTTVSIVISLDGILNRVKECLKSIQANTAEPHELLLVDHGVNKSILKWAHQLEKDNDHCHVVECAGPAGQTESINKAIQKASGEMVILLHNDVVVPEGWLNAFKMCFNLVPNLGVVGPMTNRAAGIQQMIHSDESVRVEFKSAAKAFYEQNQYRRVTTRKLSAFCLAFRRELPDKIGYLDEQFVLEEVVVEDFCKRAASGGYQNLIAADTYVYHYDRHKIKKNASTINSASTADRKKYKEKWNGTQNPEAKALQTVQLLARAEELGQKGKIDAAVEVLLGGIGVQSEDPRFYLTLSEILLAAKKFQDAKEALTEMPSADEKQEIRKAELLAYAEEGLENYEAAQAQIEQVLLMNPGHASALNLLGILAYRDNDRSSAEKYYKRAIDADPGYGEPYTNLGMLQLEADQQEEALKSFEKGFRLTPTDFDIATNYHTLIAGIAEYQKAENVARDVAFLYPNNQKIKYMLIDFLIQQGKYEMAMPEIEDAIIKFGTDNEILSAALKVREKLGPITIQKSLEKVPVSLCMIIKDEEKYLARCLASVKPIVDEMIVVDTGSTDRSKDIAITFGAKVYDYEWKNDFAEARNYSISKASGEWILILDGDEVISPLDHAHFSKMVKKTPRVPIAYSIITRNYNKLANIVGWMPNDGTYPEEEAAIGWLSSEKVRLFYGKDQIWFEGAVHELVDPVLKKNCIEIKKCRLPVHHYGRLDNEKLERKGEIYFDIGKKKLSAMGDDLNALRELAVQATILEKNQEAFELWQRLLSLNPIPNLAAIAYVNMGTIYSRLGKFEDALDAGKKAVKHDPDLKEARYNHAMAELHCGNAPKTIRVLEDLLKGFPDYPPARFILSAAYCCAHQKEKGLEGIRKLRDTPMGTHLDIPCLELAQSLISAGKMEYALWVLGAAIESDIVNPQLLVLFKECLNMKEATQKCSHIPQPPQANFQETILENLPQ